jgi:succinate-semialdehyde dehydrogenase/glutarate-semialdehyde dehydrogenase
MPGALRARIQTGTVNITRGHAATWRGALMGGWKQSGLERRHGRHGILKYTDPQICPIERVLNIGTPPFLSHFRHGASVMSGPAPAQARPRHHLDEVAA